MELSFQNVDQVCAGVDLTANQPLRAMVLLQ